MAVTKRVWIFITFVFSCIATVVAIVCIGTRDWVTGEATYDQAVSNSQISYGLFAGNLVRGLLETPRTYEISMTCIFSEGICGLSCLSTSDAREAEIQQIYNGERPLFACAAVSDARFEVPNTRFDVFLNRISPRAASDVQFIRSSMWICTILFLSLAIAFGALSAIFSVINTAGNPVTFIFNVPGLYILNGGAALSVLLSLILWGAEFGENISSNIAITDTLLGDFTSDGLTYLGYSYWLMLCTFLLHVTNIVLLIFRQVLISREPPPPKINIDENADGIIFLY